MKVLLLWVVAAWVVTVTADRPCAEYCVYLSSGIRDLEFQPGCDCMYEETRFKDGLEDSAIYYEPVNFIPLPAYIHNQPFYILNPIIQRRQTYATDNNPVMPDRIQPSPNSRTFNTEIELNIENTQSTNNQRLSAPLYLDINVESGNIERSASTDIFTPEELKLTEQSLLECVHLYTVLNSRKNTKTYAIDTANPIHESNEYDYLSNVELRKVIQNKCSDISHIVERNLNEIKKSRPRLTSVTFKIDGENKQNKEEPHLNNIHNTNKHTSCTSATENNSHLPHERKASESKSNEYDENQEQNMIIYTDSDKNTSDTLTTSASEISPTAKNLTSVLNTQASTNTYTEIKKISAGGIVNEYPLYQETITSHPTTTTSESSISPTDILASTNTIKQGFLENRDIEQEFKGTNVQGRSENRLQYEEGEVSLPRIITHEFNNNTVQSFINGIEDIPNGDFKDEMNPTKRGNEIESSNNILQYNLYTGSTPAEFETSTPTTESHTKTSSDISGGLYFVFENHQIPARFIQNLNGTLHLGIDGVTLCNTLTQNSKHNSTLLTMLCNCYKSGNCTPKQTD